MAVGNIEGDSRNSANGIGGRAGTRASGFGHFICDSMVGVFAPSALRYILMAFQAILPDIRPFDKP